MAITPYMQVTVLLQPTFFVKITIPFTLSQIFVLRSPKYQKNFQKIMNIHTKVPVLGSNFLFESCTQLNQPKGYPT